MKMETVAITIADLIIKLANLIGVESEESKKDLLKQLEEIHVIGIEPVGEVIDFSKLTEEEIKNEITNIGYDSTITYSYIENQLANRKNMINAYKELMSRA